MSCQSLIHGKQRFHMCIRREWPLVHISLATPTASGLLHGVTVSRIDDLIHRAQYRRNPGPLPEPGQQGNVPTNNKCYYRGNNYCYHCYPKAYSRKIRHDPPPLSYYSLLLFFVSYPHPQQNAQCSVHS